METDFDHIPVVLRPTISIKSIHINILQNYVSFELRTQPFPNIYLLILPISPSADNTPLMLLYPITINKIGNIQRKTWIFMLEYQFH